MRDGGIHVGRVAGIPISLDYSWFAVVAIMTWSLATGYYPVRFPEWSPLLLWTMGTLTTLALFVSVLFHEFGHAFTALSQQIPVRRIRLMFLGGIAELGGESENPFGDLMVNLMGPIVSGGLATILGAAWMVGWGLARAEVILPGLPAFTAFVGYLAMINLGLLLFNLIPGFPLDGGRVLRSVLWAAMQDRMHATHIVANIGRLVSFGFIGFGIFQLVSTGDFGGLWLVMLGMFLQRAGRSEMAMHTLRLLLEGRTVAHVMMYNPSVSRLLPLDSNDQPASDLLRSGVTVSPETTLWLALQRMDHNEIKQIPIMIEQRVLGVLRRDDIFRHVQMLRVNRSLTHAGSIL
jgi:Zn-dependent protease